MRTLMYTVNHFPKTIICIESHLIFPSHLLCEQQVEIERRSHLRREANGRALLNVLDVLNVACVPVTTTTKLYRTRLLLVVPFFPSFTLPSPLLLYRLIAQTLQECLSPRITATGALIY